MDYSRSRAVTVGLLLFLLQVQALNVPVSSPQDPSNAVGVLRNVMVRDYSWRRVLEQRLNLDQHALVPHLTGMLANNEMNDGVEITALQVVRYLVANPGVTGSEIDFGVQALGAALSCQLSKTVVVHTYYTLKFASRSRADVRKIRWCMSKIQMALPGYLSKLDVFNQPLDHLIKLNERMNEVFEKHDADKSVGKEDFTECLTQVQTLIKEHLSARCGGSTEEKDIVKTIEMSSFSEKIFEKTVMEAQLLEMIENINDYKYADIVSGVRNADFWRSRLKIKEYKLEGKGLKRATVENNDEE